MKLASGVIMHPELAEDLKETIEEKKKEIEGVEQELAEAENIESDFIEFTVFSIDYIKKLKDHWWDLEHSERVECKLLISKQEIYINHAQKVYTPEISPILKLIGTEKEAFRASDSHMVEVAGVAPASKKLKTYHLQA